MYEFICERLIPGCTTTERDTTEEGVREKAHLHLRDHHDFRHLDEHLHREVDTAIIRLRS